MEITDPRKLLPQSVSYIDLDQQLSYESFAAGTEYKVAKLPNGEDRVRLAKDPQAATDTIASTAAPLLLGTLSSPVYET